MVDTKTLTSQDAEKSPHRAVTLVGVTSALGWLVIALLALIALELAGLLYILYNAPPYILVRRW